MGWYENLVKKRGEKFARAEMARRRSLVKNHARAGSFRDPEFAKAMSIKGVEARAKKQKELAEREAIESAHDPQGEI